MIFRTLTTEQIKVVQEMINKNFSGEIYAEQISEALELILESVENMLRDEKKVEEIVHLLSYNKNRNARRKTVVSRVQPKNALRKYGNKNPVIKNTFQEVEVKREKTRIDAKEDKYKKKINKTSSKTNISPDYDTIALNVVNSYLEEPKNGDNNDDDETWYPCNEEIHKDWLDPNNCEKLSTTFVEVELDAME
ncbi:hypothetical protein F8M41_020302 [Gigaspora margarita]|uniref:Uncharacterized protein n=1 Tax=Gigaspora margarita TaxID=4874 RepID=A0A8H4AIL8_GIGMA|nr:hypothetical protein F8M41_020302 [Gigaspora margarita]